MVRLREIPRTATFAWSPDRQAPLIATGTRTGAVDADFSNETTLELWDMGLGDSSGTNDGYELSTPTARVNTDSGFHDIAWTTTDDASRGVIAGALGSGHLDLWNADKLLAGESDPFVSRLSYHNGPVKALQFNPQHHNLLASAGAKGELFITDLNNCESKFRLGNSAARSDDIECLDWNKRVPHIVITGSNAGFVTVWDVRTRKETLTLNNFGRKAVSAIAFDPERPTKLVTASPLDTDPLIEVWDLRNSNASERTLRGHQAGVLSLSWCVQDPSLLLSSGKDNRTICWDPHTGDQYGEFPVVTNWTFQTRFNPRYPNMFATASFDGRVSAQTLQNTRSGEAATAAAADLSNEPADDMEFFSKAQAQPQVSTFSLPKAPKWLERPCSVSFGFGGKVISVGLTAPGSRTSKVEIAPFSVDPDIAVATDSFEQALQKGDVRAICQSRIERAQTEEEKEDWKVIETLTTKQPKKEIIEHLGFTNKVDDAVNAFDKLTIETSPKNADADANVAAGGEDNNDDSKSEQSSKRHKRITSMFEASPESENFLNDLSLNKTTTSHNPFHVFTGNESEADRAITQALMLGQFESAMNICLKEDRMTDALMFAICGGERCIKKAQEKYYEKQSQAGGSSYPRLLASITTKNLWDIVHNVDLANWKEAIATICTYCDDGEFPDLCEVLGDRLEESWRTTNNVANRKDASLCYLMSSTLEKVISIWVEESKENERNAIQKGAEKTSFSIHAQGLQDLIEKVTVFRQITQFNDTEKSKPDNWKLAQLYDAYVEYANLVASVGRLDVSKRYLDLLPNDHPEALVARERITLATRTVAKTTPVAKDTTPAPVTTRPARLPPMPATAAPPAPSVASAIQNPYAPSTIQQSQAAQVSQTRQAPQVGMVNSYAPTGSIYNPSNPYDRPGYNYGNAPVQPPPPPPQAGASRRGTSAQSSLSACSAPAWNDIPEGFVKNVPRRAVPNTAATAIPSPFNPPPQAPASQQQPIPPPPMGKPRTVAAPPPPPPMTGPPRTMASPSPNVSSPKTITNSYAPQPSMMASQGPSQIPYAAPPPPAPVVQQPMNPYAPPPPPTTSAAPLGRTASPYAPQQPPQSAPNLPHAPPPAARVASPYAPPPQMSTAPPPPGPSPYSPRSSTPAVQNPYAPPPATVPPAAVNQYAPRSATPGRDAGQSVPPPPQHGAAPDVTQSRPSAMHSPAPPPSSTAGMSVASISRPTTAQSQRKYPPGDRSHIPANAMPIYEILSADMARVSERAPSQFKAQVNDAERRLDLLYEHLNNENLLRPPTIDKMVSLATALQHRDYEGAIALHLDILTNNSDECGKWMVGVKRLISMSRATP